MIVLALASTRLKADIGTCGGVLTTLPFTDVPSGNIFFCSIAEAFFSGLANGTTATTYDPSANVPREQMAAFVTRTMDQSVKRSSRRAALDQYWTTQGPGSLALTTVGFHPHLVKSDGADVWVANDDTVSRVRASDGRLLETWTGAPGATGVLCAMGKVFVTELTTPGELYQIDPTQPPGPVTVLSNALGGEPEGIAFDGSRIWTADGGQPDPGSVSIITLNPVAVNIVTTGFTSLAGIIYDGQNMWVTDASTNKLYKLDSSGAILSTTDVGVFPHFPAFDGTNIWVPNFNSNTVTVVRATGGLAGTVLAILSGNGLLSPYQVAFDGERILATNFNGDSVSLWKAADFTPLGTLSTGPSTRPFGACSDGLNFWIALSSPGVQGKLARF
jgi:hypothetical protein